MATIETQTPPHTGDKLDNRVGFYSWGGPGTIRMIKVKYFNPRIDEHSLMTCYDYDYLARVQDLFGITDFWAMYSWGFNDETEAEDRRFLLDRLDNFKRLGIRLHAYIQGPNLVYADFPDKDWWARDERGRTIAYYKGRHMCSIHNTDYVDYILNKIRATYDMGFDGIYVDNIQHGQLGAPAQPGKLPFVFAGDRSQNAQRDFKAATGHDIPLDFEAEPAITQTYLDFRVAANTRFINQLAETVHAGGMEFGTNYYDPKFNPRHIYGVDLNESSDSQDYILFETHALPRDDGRRHNGYIDKLMQSHSIDKPVFVVAYAHGVGMEPQFTQAQIDNIFSEGTNAQFHVCLKGSEFTTKRLWHNLYLDGLTTPQQDKPLRQIPPEDKVDPIQVLFRVALVRKLLKRYYNPVTHLAFESRLMRMILYVVYDLVIK